MHQLLHDYFWVYVVIIVAVCGAAVYLMPKLTGFLEKTIDRDLRGGQERIKQKGASETISENNKNRYKSF